MAGPWYSGGLRFECQQCGNCCTGGPGAVWVTEEEIVQIAEFLDKPVGEIRLMHTRPLRNKISLREYPNGECVYFDGMARKCTIYPVRPAQCRTWPFWRSLISSSSTWNSLQRNCPGINQGELVQLEEIEKRASELEL